MSQYRWMRSLVTVSTLGAVAATGCFVVDDTSDSDDDDNGGEDSGGSAGTGRGGRGGSSGSSTGGSSGSVSTGGASTGGASTGGSGGECVEAGGVCAVPTDCCAVLDETGYCVSGACADACITDADCVSGCCAGLTNGGSACGPVELCETPPGDAVMKFCNELYLNGTDVVPLTVVFAGVEATALSGECTPIVPNPCISIPSGTDPSVVLLDDTGAIIVEGSFPTLTIAVGDEILVDATVDELDYPTVLAGQFDAAYVCADTDPLPPGELETKSAPYSLPYSQDARHGLKRAISRETRAALPAYRLGTNK